MSDRLDEIKARRAELCKIYLPPIVQSVPDDLRYLLAEVERLARERDESEAAVRVLAASLDMANERAERWKVRRDEQFARAESAEAEVDTLRATVQRIEDLADEWVRLGEVDVENQREHWAAADRLTMLLEGGDR